MKAGLISQAMAAKALKKSGINNYNQNNYVNKLYQ